MSKKENIYNNYLIMKDQTLFISSYNEYESESSNMFSNSKEDNNLNYYNDNKEFKNNNIKNYNNLFLRKSEDSSKKDRNLYNNIDLNTSFT